MLTKDKFNNSEIGLITLVVMIMVIIILAAVIMTLYGDKVVFLFNL